MKRDVIYYAKLFSAFVFLTVSYVEDSIPGGQALMLLSLAAMLFFQLFLDRGRLRFQMDFFPAYLLLFAVYCLVSAAWAESPARARKMFNGEFFIFVMMTVVWYCLRRDTGMDALLRILMYSGYAVILYTAVRFGFRRMIVMLSDNARLTNEVVNSNTVGMCAAYSVVVNMYFILHYRKLRPTDLMIPLSVVILAVSGSRKGLIILVVGTFGVFILKNLNNKEAIKSFFKVVLVIVALVVGVYELSRLPAFSAINKRMNDLLKVMRGLATRSTAGYIRTVYNRIGWELFLKHPWTGIGINNSALHIAQYYGHPHLHNNFIELLACGGVIGFLLHYSLYIYLAAAFFRYRRYRDRHYDICLVLFALRTVMGYGHIQYYSDSTYFFLLVFWIEIRAMRAEVRQLTPGARRLLILLRRLGWNGEFSGALR